MKLKIFDLPKWEDHRGFLTSFWKTSDGEYVEDRFSYSTKGVLRGLHGDLTTDKLIVVVSGKVEFFATPYHMGHPDWGNKTFITLDSKKPQAIFLPKGYINGHLCLSDDCVFLYKWTKEYAGPEAQVTVKYDDPTLDIKWSIKNPTVSDRDMHGKSFSTALIF